VQNQSFVDATSGTAFAATYTFLAINGLYLKATPETSFFVGQPCTRPTSSDSTKLVPWDTRTLEEDVTALLRRRGGFSRRSRAAYARACHPWKCKAAVVP